MRDISDIKIAGWGTQPLIVYPNIASAGIRRKRGR